MTRKIGVLTACLSLIACALWAQKSYTVQYTSSAITIDGQATEAAWTGVSSAGGDFVGHDTGIPGLASTEQTTFKAVWDATNLYIFITTQDGSLAFDANLTTNNATLTFAKDDFELFLDPISSRNTEPNPTHKYQMVLYPQTDATGQAINPPTAFKWVAAGNTDFPFPPASWPSGLLIQAGFVTFSGGYAVELAIPWTAFDNTLVNTQPINLPPANGDVWSVQVCRLHSGGNNTAASKWNPTATGGFRTKPWGLWTFTGAPASTAATDWQLLE